MVRGKPCVCVASHRISSGGVLTTGCAFSVLQMELASSLISGGVISAFRVTFKMFAMYDGCYHVEEAFNFLLGLTIVFCICQHQNI